MSVLILAMALGGADPDAARIADRAARTTIRRDDYGIAHVRAGSDADAVFGMAYAQAEDDFNRVEVNYLTALGRLAERDGEQAYWSDVRQRLWIDEADLKARYAASPDWLKAIAEGWADGLNLFVARNPDKPKVLRHFEPWMTLAFSEGSIGGDIEYVSTDDLKSLYGGAPRLAARFEMREPQGSNGFAIAPSRTQSGAAMLLINPHTSHYFRDVVHVKSDEGLDVFGAVTWGQPFVYQGFNRRMGWMHTSSGLDSRDDYAVAVARDVEGNLTYRYGDEIRSVGTRPIQVRVRQSDGSTILRGLTALTTVHGPVVRSEKGKLVSFSIMHRPDKALEQSFLRTKARSVADFIDIAGRRANSSNNSVLADADGNIALLLPQFVPVRDPAFDYRFPVDGNDPRTAWKGDHGIASVPGVIDPDNGFVFNVNDAPWSAAGKGTLRKEDYPAYMDQWGWNARTDQALALLPKAKALTAEGMEAIAFDPYIRGMDRIMPGLVRTLGRLPAARRQPYAEAAALLGSWDRRWSADSEATSLAIHYAEELMGAAMAGVRVTDEEDAAYPRMEQASDATRLAALDRAMARMRALYGGIRVRWGDIHRLQRNDGAIRQAFSDEKPSKPVPFVSATWGSLASAGASTYPGTTKRYATSGNSFLAIVEFLPDGPRARSVTVGGVSGEPGSPFFDNQDEAFLSGKLLPVRFSDEDVAAHSVAIYHPGEAWRK